MLSDTKLRIIAEQSANRLKLPPFTQLECALLRLQGIGSAETRGRRRSVYSSRSVDRVPRKCCVDVSVFTESGEFC